MPGNKNLIWTSMGRKKKKKKNLKRLNLSLANMKSDTKPEGEHRRGKGKVGEENETRQMK
jgi:hypothetical protein